MNYQVMIVDDDPDIRESLQQWLELADIDVTAYTRADEALASLTPEYAGVIVSDMRMPGIDGMAFLQQVPTDIPFIVITGHGGIAMAVEAMKAGAYDFVEKPYKPDRLVDMVRTACRQRLETLRHQNTQHQLESLSGIESDLIGQSPAMEKLRHQVLALAKINADVVIYGETGCGKELVASCLHKYSVRHRHEFVPINVAAIPENLIESELFGYEAGAFTDAKGAHAGKFEFAHGGTLLLDEIESMPMYFQVKLLRVLQERVITRIGSNRAKAIDVRVIAATKKDLKVAAQEGEFREDLYYRLLVSEIRIPPLRERKEDISMLFHHFMKLAAETNQLEAPQLSVDDEMLLQLHHWPGNIRELKNTAERYVLTHTINQVSLAEVMQVQQTVKTDSLSETSLNSRLEQVEKILIEAELKRHQGKIKAVMEALDLPRRTLNQKMLKYELKKEDYL